MDLNFLVFPVPRASYTYEELQDQIIFIPKFSPEEIQSLSQKLSDTDSLKKLFPDEDLQYHIRKNRLYTP